MRPTTTISTFVVFAFLASSLATATEFQRQPQGVPALAFPTPVLAMPTADQIMAAPISPETASGPSPEAMPAFFRDIKFSGNLDAYYSYNFNQPRTQNPIPVGYGSAPPDQNIYVVPNNYHDQITLNFAELKMVKEAKPVGFRIDLGFGPWADALSGDNNSLNLSDSGSRFIMQAYMGYKFDFGLLAEVGKFKSDMGFESTDPSENWNYSMTLSSRFLLPYWHTGLRLSMPVDHAKTINVSGYVYNGINNFYENNGSKIYGLQVKAAVSNSVSIVANWLTGVDVIVKGDLIAGTPLYVGSQNNRNIYEGIGLFKILENLKLAIDYILASESVSSKSSSPSNSVALFANWKFGDKLYFLPRYELYNDTGSTFATLQVQQITSATAAIEYQPAEDLRLQLEYRLEASNAVPYTNSAGPSQTQAVATAAALLSF